MVRDSTVAAATSCGTGSTFTRGLSSSNEEYASTLLVVPRSMPMQYLGGIRVRVGIMLKQIM